MVEFGTSLGNLGFGLPASRRDEQAANIIAVAEYADRVGLGAIWLGDHLALPRTPSTAYPYGDGKYMLPSESLLFDPLATAGVLVGRTKRIKVGFGVLVAPYRHPLAVSKILSTLDVLSGGRIVLGLGAGWLPEEFDATGADFKQRGAMTDEWIKYVRATWTSDYPEFQGRFYRISGMSVMPRPVQRGGIPIGVGGVSKAAMRRAAILSDAWDALYSTPENLPDRLAAFRRVCKDVGRDPATVKIAVRGSLLLTKRPATGPYQSARENTMASVRETIHRYAALGASHITVTVDTTNRGPAIEALEQFAKEVMPEFK